MSLSCIRILLSVVEVEQRIQWLIRKLLWAEVNSGHSKSRRLLFPWCKFSALLWFERVFILAFLSVFLAPWRSCAAEKQLDITLTNKTGILWYKGADAPREISVLP